MLLAPLAARLCGEALLPPGRRLALLMLGGGSLAFVAQVPYYPPPLYYPPPISVGSLAFVAQVLMTTGL